MYILFEIESLRPAPVVVRAARERVNSIRKIKIRAVPGDLINTENFCVYPPVDCIKFFDYFKFHFFSFVIYFSRILIQTAAYSK